MKRYLLFIVLLVLPVLAAFKGFNGGYVGTHRVVAGYVGDVHVYSSAPAVTWETLTLDFQDYDDSATWAHSTEGTPPFSGVYLKKGYFHDHVSGWGCSYTRNGSANNFGRIPPPSGLSSLQCSLMNIKGAKIESPLLNGIGSLSFDVVNNQLPVSITVYKATTMYDSVNEVFVPMTTTPSATVDYAWEVVDNLNLNYTVSGTYLA